MHFCILSAGMRRSSSSESNMIPMNLATLDGAVDFESLCINPKSVIVLRSCVDWRVADSMQSSESATQKKSSIIRSCWMPTASRTHVETTSIVDVTHRGNGEPPNGQPKN